MFLNNCDFLKGENLQDVVHMTKKKR